VGVAQQGRWASRRVGQRPGLWQQCWGDRSPRMRGSSRLSLPLLPRRLLRVLPSPCVRQGLGLRPPVPPGGAEVEAAAAAAALVRRRQASTRRLRPDRRLGWWLGAGAQEGGSRGETRTRGGVGGAHAVSALRGSRTRRCFRLGCGRRACTRECSSRRSHHSSRRQQRRPTAAMMTTLRPRVHAAMVVSVRTLWAGGGDHTRSAPD
jgi:hypothetical protein